MDTDDQRTYANRISQKMFHFFSLAYFPDTADNCCERRNKEKEENCSLKTIFWKKFQSWNSFFPFCFHSSINTLNGKKSF